MMTLTLHPVPPDFVSGTFLRWLEDFPPELPTSVAEALAAARLFVRASAPGPGPSPLERALGATLAHRDIYWVERSPGLRHFAAELPVLRSFLRPPLQLLEPAFPEAAWLGAPSPSCWLPEEGIAGLRDELRRVGPDLRHQLRRLGAFSYFASLVEATGYCLDRGYGLLELAGVAGERGGRADRVGSRGCFDRFGRMAPEAGPPLARPPLPAAEISLHLLEERLEQGALDEARELLGLLRQAEHDPASLALYEAWLELLQRRPEPAGLLLADLAGRLPAELQGRYRELSGWALLDAGRPTEALGLLLAGLEDPSCSLEAVERCALAAIHAGQEIPRLTEAVGRCLTQLTPLGERLLTTGRDWLEDPEARDRLPEPERYACFLALLGRLHHLGGFPEHARHELQLALLLANDLPRAQGWLAEVEAEIEAEIEAEEAAPGDGT